MGSVSTASTNVTAVVIAVSVALTAQRTFEVTLENGELYVTPSGDSKQPLVFRSGNTYALGSSDSTTTVTFIVENGVATGVEANDNGSRRTLKKIK